MVNDSDLYSLPLSCLPLKSRDLLSCLLDTIKIIPTDGPEKLPRDWRGLAYLVNISSERAAYIQQREHKTKEVLKIWQQDCTATVGQLLNYLERLDRFDVHDDLRADLRESIKSGELVVNRQNQIALIGNNNENIQQEEYDGGITIHDRPGYEQHYDAFVLYAKQDKRFVDELMQRMTAQGYYLCTENELQVGNMPYAPVARLISERCRRIILVYSPEFLSSPANTFYRDYAQAVSIESSKKKIIPIMYRYCQLPFHLAFYHGLRYDEDDERALYDFWQKLKQTLEISRSMDQAIFNRFNGTRLALQQPTNIVQPPSIVTNEYSDDNLFLPNSPQSISLNDLDSLNVSNLKAECNSLSSVSQRSACSDDKKKKTSKISRLLNSLKLKKPKKVAVSVT